MAEEALLESPSDQTIEAEPSAVDKGLAELEAALAEPKVSKNDTLGEQKPAQEQPPIETAKTPEQQLEEQLKAIEEPPKVEKTLEPQLSPEQKQVLDIFPNAAKATEVLTLASGYNNFTQAFAGGDFKNVDSMLERWDPQATEAFREYVFDKFVRNGDWVDRWIAEKEGRGEENKDVRSLKQTVAKLQQQIEGRRADETAQARQAAFQNTVNGFVNHVEGLFKLINTTDETDKKIIWSMVNSSISGDQGLKNAIHQGNFKAVNTAFKDATKTYFTKNRAVTAAKETKVAQQAQHKPPVQAGVMQELQGQLSDDIKQVPKGQEDNWLDQQLSKLSKRAKR